jgi:hypothetical protein
MTRLFSAFWVAVTIVFSIMFTALFFPLVLDRYGPLPAFLLTVLGLLIIWAVYFVRALIFSRMDSTETPRHGHVSKR